MKEKIFGRAEKNEQGGETPPLQSSNNIHRRGGVSPPEIAQSQDSPPIGSTPAQAGGGECETHNLLFISMRNSDFYPRRLLPSLLRNATSLSEGGFRQLCVLCFFLLNIYNSYFVIKLSCRTKVRQLGLQFAPQ